MESKVLIENVEGYWSNFIYNGAYFEYKIQNKLNKNNIKKVINDIKFKIKLLYQKYNDRIRIWGKLCGGYYPHNSVSMTSTMSELKPNSKVYYSPNVIFVCYGIKIGNNNINYIDICKEFKLLYPKYVNDKNKKKIIPDIPKHLGLPQISNNYISNFIQKSILYHYRIE